VNTEAHGLENGTGAPVAGYGVALFTWAIEVYPGGPVMEVNGPIQEAVAQVSSAYPEYEAAFNASRAALNSSSNDVLNEPAPLFKRDDVTCCGFGKATDTGITEGIQHLRTVSGQPTNGPGPGNCGRVSCDISAAIWWCNDVSGISIMV
jgi:hypothetical protein